MKYKIGDIIKTFNKNNIIQGDSGWSVFPHIVETKKLDYMIAEVTNTNIIFDTIIYYVMFEDRGLYYLREEWIDRKIEEVFISLKQMRSGI